MQIAGYRREAKELADAALVLTTFKHTKFDDETLAALEELKEFHLRNRTAKPINGRQMECSLPGNHLCNLCSHDDIPPVACLQGLITQCSQGIEKQLTESDVRDDQCRLSLNRALVEERLIHLFREDENVITGVPVTVYDSQGNQYEMVFKFWAGKYYVLTKGWKQFYKDHELRKLEDYVTVWMFRHAQTQKLCFLITSRRVTDFRRPANKKRKLKK